jgi:hypothetical protein
MLIVAALSQRPSTVSRTPLEFALHREHSQKSDDDDNNIAKLDERLAVIKRAFFDNFKIKGNFYTFAARYFVCYANEFP